MTVHEAEGGGLRRPSLEAIVLAVHRRNGGTRSTLDLSLRLLDPALRLDSLDLAEIMVAVEREFGISPFDAPVPPRTWGELSRLIGC
jgi:hypothetical protein